jgi:hypothetical protein
MSNKDMAIFKDSFNRPLITLYSLLLWINESFGLKLQHNKAMLIHMADFENAPGFPEARGRYRYPLYFSQETGSFTTPWIETVKLTPRQSIIMGGRLCPRYLVQLAIYLLKLEDEAGILTGKSKMTVHEMMHRMNGRHGLKGQNTHGCRFVETYMRVPDFGTPEKVEVTSGSTTLSTYNLNRLQQLVICCRMYPKHLIKSVSSIYRLDPKLTYKIFVNLCMEGLFGPDDYYMVRGESDPVYDVNVRRAIQSKVLTHMRFVLRKYPTKVYDIKWLKRIDITKITFPDVQNPGDMNLAVLYSIWRLIEAIYATTNTHATNITLINTDAFGLVKVKLDVAK